MNIVCRVCRTWILQQRIQSEQRKLERVAFAWSHDPVLARRLVRDASARVARDLSLFKDGERLRIALFRALLTGLRGYQSDYQDVLSFAPAEKMSAARKPMVRQVRRALDQLDPLQRIIVAMIDLGGCSYREIEQVVELSRAELLAQICHARVQLKTLLFNPAARAQVNADQRLWSSQ